MNFHGKLISYQGYTNIYAVDKIPFATNDV